MDEVTQTLLQAGPLGAVLVAAGVYIFWLHRQLKAVQDSRVTDAQKVVTTLLALNDKWQSTIGDLSTAVDRLNTTIEASRNRRGGLG
jgi:hypothetical protein